MNIAAILALLVTNGVCAKTDFHAPNGATLQVVVCPMMAPGGPQEAPERTPDAAPPAPPPAPPKEERRA